MADSACSVTAYLSGVKANYQTIGVTGHVSLNDCAASSRPENHVPSIIHLAQKAGKATGVITTAAITDASAAGTYAHVAHRSWECDADVINFNQNPATCQGFLFVLRFIQFNHLLILDIASQMVNNEPGKNINVIFGGGRNKFMPKFATKTNSSSSSSNSSDSGVGQRLDGVNLIEEWLERDKTRKYVSNKKELFETKLNYKETKQIIGLFANNDMSFNLDADREKEPTLKEMTVAAIDFLRQDKNGFVMFIEGANIDKAHHYTMARKALDETVQVSEHCKVFLKTKLMHFYFYGSSLKQSRLL